MGEGMNNDGAIMPFINSANIACGFHAGDDHTINASIDLCLQHHVNIGAHPSFNDRLHFGRKNMQLSESMIHELISTQLFYIDKIITRLGGRLHHVKPHGALYNMAATDLIYALAIAKAVKAYNPALLYYGLSGSMMIKAAMQEGLQVRNEVFADRTYQSDGTLTPRSAPGAIINDMATLIAQVRTFVHAGKVETVTGEEISLRADTICIHGDGPHALAFVMAVHKTVHEQ